MRRRELIVHVTPLQHRLLRDHAWALADAAYEDVEGRGELAVADGNWRLFDRLPPCTFRQDAEWRRRFARSFVYLAEDLEAGVSPVPRTMCEQIALLLIVEDASSAYVIGGVDPDAIAVSASSRDRDWTASLRSLANELAVARLHDPHLAPTWLRILPMERWFDADEPGAARDPQRGVYR